jgi:hypothetical protein
MGILNDAVNTTTNAVGKVLEIPGNIISDLTGSGINSNASQVQNMMDEDRKKGQKPSYMAKGGKVRSASSRADGIAQRGKTRGKIY